MPEYSEGEWEGKWREGWLQQSQWDRPVEKDPKVENREQLVYVGIKIKLNTDLFVGNLTLPCLLHTDLSFSSSNEAGVDVGYIS